MWVYLSDHFRKFVLHQKYVAFVGSGGKTSLAEYAAAELLQLGKKVAITTTTKIFVREPYCTIGEVSRPERDMPFMRIGRSVEEGKLTGLSFEDLERLGEMYDVVLIEADGAKGLPLKFPASHEPVIPPFSDAIFVVSGLDGLFGRVDQKVFRWESFCDATGMAGHALVDPEVFLRFFADDALLKGVDKEKCTVVLNKLDALTVKEEAFELGKRIIDTAGIREVIIASALHKVFYHMEALSS